MNCRFIFTYPLRKYPFYSIPYIAPHKYLYMAYILKSLILLLQNLSKTAEAYTSGEVTCPSQSTAMSLLHHLGHNGTLWASPQEDQPCPGGAAWYKASQISASHTQRNLQLDPLLCKTFIFPLRLLQQHTWGVRGASAQPPHCFPCFGACRRVGRQLLNFSQLHQWATEREEQTPALPPCWQPAPAQCREKLL